MTPRAGLAAIALCLGSCAAPPAKPGIDLDLAKARASSISNIRYGLVFRMTRGMKAVRGEVTITFENAGRSKSAVELRQWAT